MLLPHFLATCLHCSNAKFKGPHPFHWRFGWRVVQIVLCPGQILLSCMSYANLYFSWSLKLSKAASKSKSRILLSCQAIIHVVGSKIYVMLYRRTLSKYMKNRLQLLGLPSFDHLIFSVCLLIFLHGTWISIYQIHLSGVNITQVYKSRKATLESLICLICHWKLSRKLLILVQISDYGEPGCQSDHNSRCVKFAYFGYANC